VLFTTLSSWALLIAKTLEEEGHDVGPVFRGAGLDPTRLADPNARYSVQGMQRLWRASESLIDDPCLGLRVAEHWHPTTFHALGYAWLASATLHEAFDRLARYLHVVSTAVRAEVVVTTDQVALTAYTLDLGDLRPAPSAGLAGLGALLRLCRLSVGPQFAPRAVYLQDRSSLDCGELAAYFGCPVSAGSRPGVYLGLVVSRTDAESALPTANAELAQANDRVVQSYLARLDGASIRVRVQSLLVDLLPGGAVQEDLVASRLALSVRTLQRRLREEGTSFKSVLDETRRELAGRYLADPDYSIGEITFLLGFSEASNFTRAFRRWYGRPPAAMRRHWLSERGAA
jgi:AraC-like DNA-binding protein